MFYYSHTILSQQKPGMDLADTYIMFVRQNQDILREKVNEEMYIEKLFDVSNYPCKVCWRNRYNVKGNFPFDGLFAKQTLLFWSLFFSAANIVDNFISLTADRSFNWLLFVH